MIHHVKGGKMYKKIRITVKLFDPWWDHVTKTYCEKCKELTPCYAYEGHFRCKKCENSTSFWIIPFGFPGIDRPVNWNSDCSALVSVEYEWESE